jgi:hypothetical protein
MSERSQAGLERTEGEPRTRGGTGDDLQIKVTLQEKWLIMELCQAPGKLAMGGWREKGREAVE